MRMQLVVFGIALTMAGASGGVVFASEAVSIEADPAVCRQLLRSVATVRNGSADYRPGLDVNGRPVTPAEGADATGAVNRLVEGVTIDLSVDLARRYGLGGAGALYGGDVPLGQATVRNGRVYINDRPLLSDHEAAVRKACEGTTK